MWPAIGELLFSVVVTYMGAIELFFVARQLFHLAFQHEKRLALLADDTGLRRLQDQVDGEIAEAEELENQGFNAMKDGVLYKDGFRIDPDEINDQRKATHQAIGDKSKINSGEIESKERGRGTLRRDRSPASVLRADESEETCIQKVNTTTTSHAPSVERARRADDERTTINQSIKIQLDQSHLEEFAGPEHFDESGNSKSPGEQPEASYSSADEELLGATARMHFDAYEREEPDGQDTEAVQYSDDYLRSLDGIKNKPLVRDDGTGRRRAFKKRRSTESTSSRESRLSREEELKMFTSLEEEEFEAIRRGDSEFVPIRYSSDPNLIKTEKHQRRHKTSPIRDPTHSELEENVRSRELLDEKNPSAWGNVKPKHYKDSELWLKEQTTSITEESEDICEEKADEGLTSTSPTKNVPKLSSFEDATAHQHEDAITTLSRQKSQDKQVKKSSESQDMEKVSTGVYSVASALVSASIREASSAAEEALACDQQPSMRRSPRLTEMDQYDEENTSFLSVSPRPSTPVRSRSLSPSQLTQLSPSQITPSDASAASHSLIYAERNIQEKSSSPGHRILTETTEKDQNRRSKTPVIEIESVDFNVSNDSIPTAPGTILEGISDFYDFNASINPSRSPSLDRYRASKSPSKHSRGSSFERQRIAPSDPVSYRPISGFSDFYDFCVMMNEVAYGQLHAERKEGHRSTTHYLEDKLNKRSSRSKSPSLRVTVPKNGALCLRQEEGGGTASPELAFSPLDIDGGSEISLSPLDTPSTPEYRRSFSETMRQVEEIRDEFRNNLFKRSTYVGESMDFENDFEELREQTRHFKRSRSKSRSPFSMDESESFINSQMAAAAKRDLQEKILEEITRTTINYQDFYRDVTKKFIEFERRGSDSALIQKPEIMIQIQDDDDLLDELEGEEYHHFRRFSLGQTFPLEEQYPESDEEEVNSPYGERSEGDRVDNLIVPEVPEEHDSDRAEVEDIDSESEDDRQTVVDVEDEIDEDVWDFDRPEESNEQSECEEADREMDPYASKNAADWSEEGAVGGIEESVECEYKTLRKDSIIIDQMYNDAVQNMEESGIERDYDSLLEEIGDVENSQRRGSRVSIGTQSTKTEDLLDEILREDEAKHKRWSSGSSHIALTNGHPISSTRLRSRYGISPATPRVNLDDLENTNFDLNYVPKKEYNWRKNFKIDDEEVPNGVARQHKKVEDEIFFREDEDNPQINGLIETETSQDIQVDETEQDNWNEQRFAQKNSADLPEMAEEPPADEEYRDEGRRSEERRDEETPYLVPRIRQSELEKMATFSDAQETKINDNQATYFVEETEVTIKKRKKKKSRKGSKGSLGENDALSTLNYNNVIENENYSESGTRKKIKKKKISAGNGTPQKNSEEFYNVEYPDTTPVTKRKSTSPPNPELLTNSHSNHTKTPSPDNLKNTLKYPSSNPSRSVSKSPELNAVRKFKDEPQGVRNRPQLERNDTFELIKDGSMYPLF